MVTRAKPRQPVAALSPRLMVEMRGVSLIINGKAILNAVDLDVWAGQTVAIIGPSGSGKTTLLRTINHLARPSAGEIRLDGERIDPQAARLRAQRAGIGMVFQNFNLFRNMTALENVMFAPVATGRARVAEAETRARKLIARVGLSDKCGSYPSELSGGQQQRIAIARALAMEPKVMLFDEATSALDPEFAREVLDVMSDLSASGMTIVAVTHEMGFARKVADRIVFMEAGSILADGTPDDLFSEAAPLRVKRFLTS